ncbi:hypothetical protein BJX70DRAFT_311343 [Aspergillus crustosus]
MLPTLHMNNFKPTQNPPRPKHCYDSPWSTLLPPKHHLPARPPAEVYMSANVEPHAYLETLKHDKNPKDSAPHIFKPDIISSCDPQDNTSIPTEPPLFWGDSAEDGLLSPSISSSDDSLEEFLRLPVIQDDIPINPVILASHGS